MVASCRSPKRSGTDEAGAEGCLRRLIATSFPRHFPFKVSPYSDEMTKTNAMRGSGTGYWGPGATVMGGRTGGL